MIVAALATIPERVPQLVAALVSLRPQVDRLYVCLNGHRFVPEVVERLADDHVRVSDGNDKGDAGKFYWADRVNADWYFTCDDDFKYEPNYVAHMIAGAERLHRRAAVSLHGVVLSGKLADGEPVDWLKHGRTQWVRTVDALAEDMPVHVAGTGVLCYPGGLLDVSFEDFRVSNMADVWFARVCNAQRVPRYVIAHEPGLATATAPPCVLGPCRRRMGGDYSRYIAEAAPWELLSV